MNDIIIRPTQAGEGFWLTADFAGARRFYGTCGYEEEARIRDYWGPGDDKVTFRKALG